MEHIDKKIGDWVMLCDGQLAYQIKNIPEVFKRDLLATEEQINEAKKYL